MLLKELSEIGPDVAGVIVFTHHQGLLSVDIMFPNDNIATIKYSGLPEKADEILCGKIRGWAAVLNHPDTGTVFSFPY